MWGARFCVDTFRGSDTSVATITEEEEMGGEEREAPEKRASVTSRSTYEQIAKTSRR
jgi:hypothetical protein